MKLLDKLHGFKSINEDVSTMTEEEVSTINVIDGSESTSGNAHMSASEAVDVADAINNQADPNLEADVRNVPDVSGRPTSKFVSVIYSSRTAEELIGIVGSIPELNNFTLVVKPITEYTNIWTPSDTVKAKGTLEREGNKKKISEIVKSNQRYVTDAYNAAKRNVDALTDESTLSELVLAKDITHSGILTTQRAIEALESLGDVDSTIIDRMKRIESGFEDVHNIIQSDIKKYIGSVKEDINKLSTETEETSDEEATRQIGKISDDYLQLVESKSISDEDKVKISEEIQKLRDKYSVNTDKLKEIITANRFADIGKRIISFGNKKYKEREVAEGEYLKIYNALEELKKENKDEYLYYSEWLSQIIQTHITSIDAIENKDEVIGGKATSGDGASKNKREKIDINKYQKTSKSLIINKEESANGIVMDYTDSKTVTMYPLNAQLPLGQVVTVNNLAKLQKDEKSKGRNPMGEDAWYLFKNFMHSAIGYEPQGGAAKAVASMKGVNRALSHLFGYLTGEVTARLMGILTGAKPGLKGKELKEAVRKAEEGGRDFGKFLTYEGMGSPNEINPIAAEYMEKFSEKYGFGVARPGSSKYYSSTRGSYLPTPKMGIKENVGGAVTPGGGAMLTPANSGPGAGEIRPATTDQTVFKDGVKTLKSDSGSGDNFQPRKANTTKKKKKNNLL